MSASVEARINRMLEGYGGPQTFEITVEAGFVSKITEEEIREAVEEVARRRQHAIGVQSYIQVEVEEIG